MNSLLLVTGGSRGIGASVARQAAVRGYDVVVNYTRDAQAAEAVAADVRAAGREAWTFQADVGDEAQVLVMFAMLDGLKRPLILLQGAEDKVVPPEQSRRMHAALLARGVPVAYLEFEGEQHGFRQLKNIVRALEAEAFFYSRILGFTLADAVPPVPIDNL